MLDNEERVFPDMKVRHVFIAFISVPLVMMSGCSMMNNNDSRPSNVAPAVAPQVAADGASMRKKPRQPEPVQQEQEIIIEQIKEEKDVPEVCETTTYVVKKGDTIYGIARKFHIKPNDIMRTNGIDKDTTLRIGQSLEIPCSRTNISQAIIQEKENGGKEYIVVAGDSLYKISRKYGISVKELRDNNNLSSDTLRVGQKLMLPSNARESAVTTTSKLGGDGTYTVVRGDSIYVIAKRFGVSQADLMRVNNISSPERLQIGQTLKIPTKDTVVTNKPTPIVHNVQPNIQPPAITDNGNLYTIQYGDTVSGIAQRLNVDKQELAALNNISTQTPLQAGKQLLIPEKKIIQETPSMTPISHPDVITDDFFDNFEEIPVVEINN